MLNIEHQYVILLLPPELLTQQSTEAVIASYKYLSQAETEIKKLIKEIPRGTCLFLWDRSLNGYKTYIWEKRDSYPTVRTYRLIASSQYYD